MKAELVPDNGDPPIAITKDLTIVGRRGYCDVVVDDPSISKRHCALVKTDGLIVIRDLGSTNGTKVKGQRVRWAALLPDDRISLGTYKFRVYLGPDDTPGPSELAEMRKARARAVEGLPPDIPTWLASDKYAEAAAKQGDRGPEALSTTPGMPEPASKPAGPFSGSDIDLAFVNTQTPVDGQELLLDFD